jgi:hypothetical protein
MTESLRQMAPRFSSIEQCVDESVDGLIAEPSLVEDTP